jgi:hypothetical protein
MAFPLARFAGAAENAEKEKPIFGVICKPGFSFAASADSARKKFWRIVFWGVSFTFFLPERNIPYR